MRSEEDGYYGRKGVYALSGTLWFEGLIDSLVIGRLACGVRPSCSSRFHLWLNWRWCTRKRKRRLSSRSDLLGNARSRRKNSRSRRNEGLVRALYLWICLHALLARSLATPKRAKSRRRVGARIYPMRYSQGGFALAAVLLVASGLYAFRWPALCVVVAGLTPLPCREALRAPKLTRVNASRELPKRIILSWSTKDAGSVRRADAWRAQSSRCHACTPSFAAPCNGYSVFSLVTTRASTHPRGCEHMTPPHSPRRPSAFTFGRRRTLTTRWSSSTMLSARASSGESGHQDGRLTRRLAPDPSPVSVGVSMTKRLRRSSGSSRTAQYAPVPTLPF